MRLKQAYIDLNGEVREVLYYNELCKSCGKSADLHFESKDHKFVRYDPPQPAYGPAWWNMSEDESKHYFRSMLLAG